MNKDKLVGRKSCAGTFQPVLSYSISYSIHSLAEDVPHLLDEGDARFEVLKQILPTVVKDRDSLVRHRPVLLKKIGHAIAGVHAERTNTRRRGVWKIGDTVHGVIYRRMTLIYPRFNFGSV